MTYRPIGSLVALLLLGASLGAPVLAHDNADHPAASPQEIRMNFRPGSLDAALLDIELEGMLTVYFQRDSLAFENTRYQQWVEGVRILDAEASEHVMKRDTSLRFTHLDLVPRGVPLMGDFAFTDAAAVEIAEDLLGVQALIPTATSHAERVWYRSTDGLVKSFAVTVPAIDPAGTWRIVIAGETGELLEKTLLTEVFDDGHDHGHGHRHDHGHGPAEATLPAAWQLLYGTGAATHDLFGRALHDHTANEQTDLSATVHRVSPTVALQDAAFRDNVASLDLGEFEAAMIQVVLEGVYEGMPLQTDGVWVVDALTVPVAGMALDFRRDDPRFLEVMIAYYVDVALDIMAEHGYADLLPYERVHAVARVPSPLPNAMATHVGDQGYIVFFYRSPTTAIPSFASTAEDAEVIIHELGHLFHISASPSTGGAFRGAWAEGSADFFAALLLEGEGLSEGFGDPCIGEWFSSYIGPGLPQHDDLLCIRILENDLVYPDNMSGSPESPGSGHFNGQFWSGPNWEIRKEIGWNESLKLFMEAQFVMPSDLATIEDLTNTVLFADCGLTACEREGLVRAAFGAKNIELAEVPEEFRSDNATDTLQEQTPAAPIVALLLVVLVAAQGLALARRRA